MSDDDLRRLDIIAIDAMSPSERARYLRRMREALERMYQRKSAAPLGWKCPGCKRIYGPKARECWVCNARR